MIARIREAPGKPDIAISRQRRAVRHVVASFSVRRRYGPLPLANWQAWFLTAWAIGTSLICTMLIIRSWL